MLNTWAKRWDIPEEAIYDLMRLTGAAVDAAQKSEEAHSESYIQSLCRINAQKAGNFLARNNVGALLDERGIPVRFGLMNDTKALNKVIKSADLIGGRRVLITPEMVGKVILQFYSVECKAENWRYSPTCNHTQAQVAWANFINSRGGYALITRNADNI